MLFYEVDLKNERYAVRMIEVFPDRSVYPVIEEGFDFVTEAPVPIIAEINKEPEFYAVLISKAEFDNIYNSKFFSGDISFPEKF